MSATLNRPAIVLLLATLSIPAGAPAAAQQQPAAAPQRQAVRNACAADYDKLCSQVQPGGGRILQCLKQNAERLSPDCRQALQSARASRPSGPAAR